MAEWLFRLLRRNTEQLTPRRRRQVITARALGAAFALGNATVATACICWGAPWVGLTLSILSWPYLVPLTVRTASHSMVRMAPVATGTLAVLGVSWAFGSDSGAHICLFMLACWPFAIFDVEEEQTEILSLLLLAGSIFIGVELTLGSGAIWRDDDTALATMVMRPILVTCSFGFFGAVLFNITKQNQEQEDNLLRQSNTLRQANSVAEAALRTRAQFLAMMSHEFRTPLNGILGPTQVLASTDLSAEQREQVELLKYSGEYMFCLVSDLLEHANAKTQALHLTLEPVELVALCEHAVDTLRSSAAAKGLALTYKAPSASVHVEADGGRLAQVLRELLGNAIKFTERGNVTLELMAELTAHEGTICTTLVISDTGCGMDEDVQSRLFKEFEQGSEFDARTADGLGLGLFKVRRIVERMGGRVDVSSSPGLGSTFRIKLPLKAVARDKRDGAGAADSTKTNLERETDQGYSRREATGSSLNKPMSIGPSVNSGVQRKGQPGLQLKVLVAEDNPVNQQILLKLLAKLGCVPTIVGDGALAVEAFKREPWDVILMDIQMPNMDGLEATREIRRLEGEGAHVKIVAVTANANPDQVEVGLQSGLDVYLTKPVRLGVLAEVLNNTLPVATELSKTAS